MTIFIHHIDFFLAREKVTVGKHRPDFLARCQPKMHGIPLVRDRPLQLWTVDVCTQTDRHVLKDGFRSFPSGHSSSKHAREKGDDCLVLPPWPT